MSAPSFRFSNMETQMPKLKSTNGHDLPGQGDQVSVRQQKRVEVPDLPAGTTEKVEKAPRGARAEKITEVQIAPIQTEVIELELIVSTPLIVNKFSEKAKREILDKQMKKAKAGRAAKDPFEDFLGSLHVLPGQKPPVKKLKVGESWPYKPNTFGFPSTAFKAAVINAVGFCGGITKTLVRGAVHVLGDLVPLKFSSVTMREDVVRVGPWGNKVADLRFRGEFRDWSVRLQVRYNKRLVSIEQIANLFEHAGFAIGVGEWRPEKSGGGSNGTFSVKRA